MSNLKRAHHHPRDKEYALGRLALDLRTIQGVTKGGGRESEGDKGYKTLDKKSRKMDRNTRIIV